MAKGSNSLGCERYGDLLELEHVIDGYYVSRPPRRNITPLHEFPPEDAILIAYEATQDEKPQRYVEIPGIAIMERRAWYEWHWHRGIDPEKARLPLSPWKRRQVIARDGLVCGLCDGDVDPSDVHIDHIVPWSKGGSDDLDNLQVSHSPCNILKGANV